VLDLPPGHSQDPSIVPPPGYWDPQSRSPYSSPFALSAESPTARRDFTVRSGSGWEFRLASRGVLTGKAVVETEVKGEAVGTMHSYAETDPDGRAVLGLPDRKGEARLTASAISVHARAVHGLLRWDDQFNPSTVVTVSRLDGVVAVRYWATDLDGRSALVESAPGDHLKPRIEGNRLVIHVDLSEKAKETLPEVAGTVVDDFGKPIAGARVEAVYVVGSTSSMGDSDDCAATTDESGRFRLAKLPAISLGKRPNALRLAVSKNAFGAVDTPPMAVEGDAPLFVPPIVLSPGCSITGVVLGPDGKPVEGAEVEPDGSFSERSRRTWTDVYGKFTVTGLPEGEIGLWVRYGELQGDPHLFTARRDPQLVEIRLKRL
jgi:hypothetical protein